MKIFAIILLCCLVSPFTCAQENKTTTVFEITAINDQLSSQANDNVRLYIENVQPGSPGALGNWQLQLRKSAQQALQAIGYYQPEIIISTQFSDNEYLAKLQIDQGVATTITKLDVTISGMAQQDPEFSQLVSNSTIQLGAQFNHGDYQGFKNAINDMAIIRGYFEARWQTSEVIIDPQLNQAKVTLVFDSGQRFKFGDIVFTRETPAQQLILSMRTFNTDEPYHGDKLASYNVTLAKSNYFSGIEVFPDLKNAANGNVPIQVSLVKKPANTIELGGGASSNDGLRGRVKWSKPWLNHYGHSLVNELKLGTVEQSFSATYKIPIEDPITNYATVALGWVNEDNNDSDTKTTKYSVQLQRYQLIEHNWNRSVFVRFEREDSRQGSQLSKTTNIIPGISYARTRLRGGLNPYWGDRQSFILELGHRSWGSDANLAKIKVRSKWLRSYNVDHQFIAKADLGAILASSIDEVPVSMRLFGGGDENLRAYEYDSVSPFDNEGELTGGLYQTNLSLEYSYLIRENWRIATFIDTGTTTNDFSETLKTDVGFGVRWITPVGPVKIDLAFGLTGDPDFPEYDRPFRLSFSIGPEL